MISKNLAKKLLGIVLITFLVAATMFSITETASAKTDWLIPPPQMKVYWESEKIIQTSKGATPMLAISYKNTDVKTHDILVVGILESTVISEQGWRIDVIKDPNPTHAFTSQYVSGNTWGGNTDSCTDIVKGSKESAMYVFVKVPATTSLSLVKVTVTVKNNYNVPTAENAYLRIVGNISHNIFMASIPFPDEIKPTQTISHPISLVNSGPVPVSVGLAYDLSFTDSDGGALDKSGWKVAFKNSRGMWDKILNNISQNSSEMFYLFLTTPPPEGAPADSKLVIHVIGSVVNDSRYGDSVSLSPTSTSSDFRKGVKDDSQDWGQLSFLKTGYWIPFIFVIVILIVIVIVLSSTKSDKRKKKGA